MVGFRAAGWTCCGTIVLALLITLVGMRGVGLVGQQRGPQVDEKPEGDIEMQPRIAQTGPIPEQSSNFHSLNGSLTTLADVVMSDVKSIAKHTEDV